MVWWYDLADYDSGILKESDEGNLQWMKRESILNNEWIVSDLPLLIEIVDKHKKDVPPLMIKYLYDDQGRLRIVY